MTAGATTFSDVGHVTCNFTVNGTVMKDYPNDFELRQAWGTHDLFFARIVVPTATPNKHLLQAWPDGAAVKVNWGRYPQGEVSAWYGYVNHHEISTNDDYSGQNVQVTYVMTGTSKVMNGDRNRAWQNYTPSAIARKIARAYSLRCVVTQTDWVLKYESQAHESDFAFLNRIADKIGYRFFVTGGTLYFIDPIVLLAGRVTGTTPTYTINKQPYVQDFAQSFKINQGDSLPGAFSAMTRRVYGIDASTGQVFHTDADNAPSQTDFIVNTTTRVTSVAQAKRIQNAQQGLSQFWVAGSVEVFGSPLLYPGKSINLFGNAIPNNDQGGWIVTSATHTGRLGGSPDATQDSFISRVNVVTNQKKRNIPYIKGIQPVTPEVINCNLAGGKWQAATLNVVIEGIV